PQDVALEANPARQVERDGLACFVAEPMIWLHDLRVAVERAADGRTARVLVEENDPLPSGERPPVEGAEVLVEIHEEGREPRRLTRGTTGPGGVFGFGTPSDVPDERVVVRVEREGFNVRRLTLDGRRLAVDLRAVLYGDA
ncbi:MAG: hypothetical protein R3263_08045, partial [Myxococcota bacterium]|nr:hypothetical protein [Myxococcota bacterium]